MALQGLYQPDDELIIFHEQARGNDERSDIYSLLFMKWSPAESLEGDNTVAVALAHLETPHLLPS